MASLHCSGFSASLSLLATALAPLSSSVNPHAPHAVEGIYAAPLAPGQPWTIVWSDERAVPTAVDAGVLVCDGANEPVLCSVEHGRPTSLRGYLGALQLSLHRHSYELEGRMALGEGLERLLTRFWAPSSSSLADKGPLKLTLLLRDIEVNEICAIFVFFCSDSTPAADTTSTEPVFLPTTDLGVGSSHNAAQNRETLYMPHRRDNRPDFDLHRRIATPQASPESMLDAAGADDSGVVLSGPERLERAQLVELNTLKHTERELDCASPLSLSSFCAQPSER